MVLFDLHVYPHAVVRRLLLPNQLIRCAKSQVEASEVLLAYPSLPESRMAATELVSSFLRLPESQTKDTELIPAMTTLSYRVSNK